MSKRRDPVEEASDGSRDLYDIATWEPRTVFDRLSIFVHGGLLRIARWVVLLVAIVILLIQFLFTGLAAVTNPVIGAFVLLSVVPALLLFIYVWWADATRNEPLGLLVMTFLLGILFAGFAAVLNSFAQPLFFQIPYPLLAMTLFFFLIVGPVEETVKWLAVRLYAYRSASFDAVIDGAVYGAAAGLGFATIENSLYIGEQYFAALQQSGGAAPEFAALPTATARTLAGPGHVIYSAFAGYYLGLAKFNPENAGPIAVKGLLIASLIHATYNSLVSNLELVLDLLGIVLPIPLAFLGFVILYDLLFGYVLYRKIKRYRKAFVESGAGNRAEPADAMERL